MSSLAEKSEVVRRKMYRGLPAAADALAPIKAGLFTSGAVGQVGTGSGVDAVEGLPTFTCPTSGIGQTQMGAFTIVIGAAIRSWRRWVKIQNSFRIKKTLTQVYVHCFRYNK